MILINLCLFVIGLAITYYLIKFAVKQAIRESLDDIRVTIKEAIKGANYEKEYKDKTNNVD